MSRDFPRLHTQLEIKYRTSPRVTYLPETNLSRGTNLQFSARTVKDLSLNLTKHWDEHWSHSLMENTWDSKQSATSILNIISKICLKVWFTYDLVNDFVRHFCILPCVKQSQSTYSVFCTFVLNRKNVFPGKKMPNRLYEVGHCSRFYFLSYQTRDGGHLETAALAGHGALSNNSLD